MVALRSRRCLVVGGGGVALRKVEALKAEGADVTVVAPNAADTIARLANAGELCWLRRPYRAGEVAGFRLVFAATGDREVNRQVFQDAERLGILVNVVDDPELCSFHVPSRIQRGSLQLTVSSEGRAPFAVRRLRQILERRIGREWDGWLDAAARFRRTVRALHLPAPTEERLYDRFVEATVDSEEIRARVPLVAETEAWLAGVHAADAQADAPGLTGARDTHPRESSVFPKGLVSLVGAGPGDPGLMTCRGYRRTVQADAIVYDRLAETALPCEVPDHVELHCVGKTAGHHPTPQDEINALLVRLAREGKRVVRLKGGDPYVFGRGGEEAAALQGAGIPFEIVPGVTAGVAVPAYAGIPVTHRREAVRVTFLTAHECAKSGGPQVRWDLLAQDAAATIVGYMGLSALANVSARLIAAGMDPATPAAVVASGTTAAQRRVVATLRELPAAAAQAEITPPALFIIGPTVRHSRTLDWLAARPLAGERLFLAAPGGALGESLELAGAATVEARLPLGQAARIAVAASPLSGCILRTADEVDLADDERDGCGWARSMIAWCVGHATAARARALGWKHVEELAEDFDPQVLVTRIAGRRHDGCAA